MKATVVTDQRQKWFEIADAAVATARDYLAEPDAADEVGVRLLNLCRTGRYQGRGYYVSLLAEARGRRPLPDVKTIEDLRSEAYVRALGDETRELVHEALRDEESERFELNVYFGKHPVHQSLAGQLFAKVRVPLLRAMFVRADGSWRVDAVHAMGLADVPLQDRAFMLEAIKAFLTDSASVKPRQSSNGSRPRLAILWDPNEKTRPSNEDALERFVKAAPLVGLEAELIGPDALERLPEFDGLLIARAPKASFTSSCAGRNRWGCRWWTTPSRS
jgi:hypothetical protein